jgi:pimeloyl-ACP methyl ester carboxylesterase
MGQISYDTDLGTYQLAYSADGAPDEIGRCGFFWLGGYKSDMMGSKAESLAQLARSRRRSLLRFDYSGHGESSGLFTDGTISAWLDQATHMFLRHTASKRIIVGSSMGGWLALLLAKRLRAEDPHGFRRIAGLVLIAPATDMTLDLMWKTFDNHAKAQLRDAGVYLRPSEYGEPYAITAKLLSDGQNHLLLKENLELPFPVRILQGTKDVDVPPEHAVKTMESLRGGDITLTLVKGGDHRLSSATELTIIQETVLRLAERADGEVL